MSFHKNIAKNMCLDAIAEEFITQCKDYSKPGLQTHWAIFLIWKPAGIWEKSTNMI